MAGIKIVARRAGENVDRLLGALGGGELLASNGDWLEAPPDCTVEAARTILAAYLWTVGFEPPVVGEERKVEVLHTFKAGPSEYRLVRFDGQRLLQKRDEDALGLPTWRLMENTQFARQLLSERVACKMRMYGPVWSNGSVRMWFNTRAEVIEVRNETNDGWLSATSDDITDRDRFDIYATALSPEGERFYQPLPGAAEAG